MTLKISAEAHKSMLLLARDGDARARREVARVFAHLSHLSEMFAATGTFWNVAGSASGVLTSRATLTSGTPVWRLCPTHAHCIALLAVRDKTLFVLDVCSKAEITAHETTLSRRSDL